MAKKHYHVIAEFVDKETENTIPAGSLFEADEERLVLLRAAEVIGKEATKAEVEAAQKAGEGDADDGKTG
ncbi:hypothetical protein BSK66_31565 [Paenibacillus odorifer]|uniref:Uncharacterized protein n=1 Tax=Paenibacillus odorifer TaxID=189426 RepID=A0A1R0XBC2_9BACL|nr:MULTISPECIES: hypothetical protein [Paenibacillus]ETT61252.1 hypothetical protein C171_12758 [Paenibacillus sp. FSL H8-237]OMD32218.1 hypothetical protein BJP51_16715 [Paenibacillus odorifer]OME46764.1 hypothetical protein BSK66_31565 [Paenibacillus odorifer]